MNRGFVFVRVTGYVEDAHMVYVFEQVSGLI